jgi:FlaA1/EpsC-like NDP-sugar epimerase
LIIHNFIKKVLAIPRFIKSFVILLLDIVLCVISVWIAFYLRLEEFMPLFGLPLWPIIASILISLPLFIVFGLYRSIFRYNGIVAFMSLTKAMLLYAILYVMVFTVYGVEGIPRSVGLIQPLLLLLLVSGSRIAVRILVSCFDTNNSRNQKIPKALIYGAGSSGRQLASALTSSEEIKIIGFLDDDQNLYGNKLNGLPIYKPADLQKIITEQPITDILLALPSISRKRRNEILDFLKNLKVTVRSLPSISKFAIGNISFSDIQNLDINDLLGRESIMPNVLLLNEKITGKVVLVSGAGGSIGSELCRQILAIGPKLLLLIDNSEYHLYKIHQELESNFTNRKDVIIPLLASIQDKPRLKEIFDKWRPDTVYQAAAYKHVPLIQQNPSEGIKNNVFGTLKLAQVALEFDVTTFVFISTDKAVRPTSIMGASKRIAEMILQALASNNPKTKLSMVRFGNVLNSSGSVVPKFYQQIIEGGPITLTHREITRYFMTIPEATQLVIQAGAMAKGGDVFVLDMGQPVRIIDLAERMIKLSGLSIRDIHNPNGDIEINVTGLRPGEKLYEETLIGENSELTFHPKIIKAYESFFPLDKITDLLNKLEVSLEVNDIEQIIQIVHQLVPEYVHCNTS